MVLVEAQGLETRRFSDRLYSLPVYDKTTWQLGQDDKNMLHSSVWHESLSKYLS
jgi:hypothetical protein